MKNPLRSVSGPFVDFMDTGNRKTLRHPLVDSPIKGVKYNDPTRGPVLPPTKIRVHGSFGTRGKIVPKREGLDQLRSRISFIRLQSCLFYTSLHDGCTAGPGFESGRRHIRARSRDLSSINLSLRLPHSYSQTSVPRGPSMGPR